jgi:hypothetical protein
LQLDSSLTAAQREAALDAVRADAKKAIGRIIGQDLLPAYLKLDPRIGELNR